MTSVFNPFASHYDAINDKDDFNIGITDRKNTVAPLETEAERNIRTRTVTPVVTGSSVAAFIFNGGVILAADVLGSYGSLAKYRNLPRIHQVNDQTVMALSGDLSDADYIKESIDAKVDEDIVQEDGSEMTPVALHAWCTRLLYHRRTKLNPLLTSVIVAGLENNEPFLGRVNDKGSAYKEFLIMTGIGNHLALGWVRTILENSAQLNKDQAEQLMDRIIKQLYYRDCRGFARYRVCIVTKDGVEFKAKEVQPDWSLAPALRNTE
ncbi:unnamed protein product [Adineta steineri]|uniref:Proteasome subunit beta n=1 Tax=Adineta steineri TaxID=433720 RepID=A0A815ANR0_9BILA|nr:unnamed protein product [Adineta steineri]CAF1226664.1 unnamed protein product [Adineta steineri]CAF1258174.1 unnamed protein product [Adineta steineri]CAF1312284.1 unnamed protein product [Adineta steineri]CAF1395477.1 unnamed protein product [Adineta steineri]